MTGTNQRPPHRTRVAFVCTHNSCRSQIAEALARLHAADVIEPFSAGTHPREAINPDAVRLMLARYGVDMRQTQRPKLIGEIPPVERVVTMGCGVECPFLPWPHTQEDWGLDDPSGQPDETFHAVIDEIERRVVRLAEELRAAGQEAAQRSR